MVAKNAGEAVRLYLDLVVADAPVEEWPGAAEIQSQLDTTQSRLEWVKLHAQLEATTDQERYEKGFVTHAKGWADANDVTASAFIAEGVSVEVLKAAGFDVAGRKEPKRRRKLAPRVTSADVIAAIPPKRAFTAAWLQERSGSSLGTVRKVIADLVADGTLVETDPPASTKQRPGASPKAYRRA